MEMANRCMSHHFNLLTYWLLSLRRNEEVCKRRKALRIGSLSSLYSSFLSSPLPQYTAMSHWEESIKFILDFSIISNNLGLYSLIFFVHVIFSPNPNSKKVNCFLYIFCHFIFSFPSAVRDSLLFQSCKWWLNMYRGL